MFKKKVKLLITLLVCVMLVNSNNVMAGTYISQNSSIADDNHVITNNSDKDITPLWTSKGENHTHQYIVKNALTILANDKGKTELNDTDTRDYILYFCDWPDYLGNETDNGTFAGHFYDPDTGKNWLGNTSPTARSRAVYYFNEAVNHYKAGNKEDAYSCLGKGLHYVGDLNEPHHASNLTALNSNHTEFEKYVDNNRTSFYIPGNTLSSSVYLSAESTSVSSLMHTTAVYAKSLVKQAQNSATYYTAADKSIKQAITCSVQYIYKFCKEVGIY